MTIEITKGTENPVADFFSSSSTPETDAALYPMNQVDIVWPEFARKLERERDEAIRQRNETNESSKYAVDYAIRERDEVREKYDTLAVENMLEVNKLCKERDEAIEILRQIKASDWKTSGELRGMARIFLDGIK